MTPDTDVQTQRPDTHAVAITLHDWIEGQPFDGASFGVLANGVDMSQKIADIYTDLVAGGGGELQLPRGRIILNGIAGTDGIKNGILYPFTSANDPEKRVLIRGQGRSTILTAGSDNMHIVRCSDNHCGLEDLTLDAGGRAGVVGLGIRPQDLTNTSNTSLSYQNYNNFDNLYFMACDEGVIFQCGPGGNGDSQCFYNTLSRFAIFNGKRAVWFKPPVGGIGSGSSVNTFNVGRCGQNMNTGVQIDYGGKNKFIGVDAEGIAVGTSPNTTPTAWIIASGSQNDGNKLFGCVGEGNTRDLYLANALTEFYGSTLLNADYVVAPLVMSGGYAASNQPQVSQGFLYQGNGQIGDLDSNVSQLTGMWGANVYSGNFRNQAKHYETSNGGMATDFTFVAPYANGAIDYLVTRGAYGKTDSAWYARRVSIFSEHANGTFTESPRLLDSIGSGAAWVQDTFGRLDSSNVRSTVNVSNYGTKYINYCSVQRLG